MEKATSIKILLISLFLVLSSSQDSCVPLWPRLQFGNIYSDPLMSEKMIIKFNTRSKCPKSFIVIQTKAGSIRKVFCENMFMMLQNMDNYQIFQQKCTVSSIQFDEKVQYLIYGANSSSKAIPFSLIPISTSIIHPNSTKAVKLFVLADWGELHQKINIYTSINKSLDSIHDKMNIDGMLINGDIAYNLDSNNGKNFEDFLNMISRIARYVPVVINTGNHQHISNQTLRIFYFTFEQYGKERKLAMGLSLGPLYLVGFDPYDLLYFKNMKRSVKKSTEQVFQSQAYIGMKEKLIKGKNLGKYIITSSHYPFICSAPDQKCVLDRELLRDFFDLMYDFNVPLYLGAHVHTYERIYPICKNGTLIKEQPFKYSAKDNCLTSIIQGTAGNDVEIVESYDGVNDFTAKVRYGITGLGVVEVGAGYINYQHYTTERTVTLEDRMHIVIKFGEEFDENIDIGEQGTQSYPLIQ